jgi:hypothetical protein
MLYKRKLKKYPATLWEKLYGPVVFFILSLTVLIATAIDGEGAKFSYAVKKSGSDSALVTSTNSYETSSGATITFKNLSYWQSFLYPNNHFVFDRFYMLFAAIVCGILIYLVYTEHKKGVFATNVSKYTKVLGTIFGIMLLLNIFRWMYLQEKIFDATKDDYDLFTKLDQFYLPEFWLMIALGVMTNVIKKGERLQNEQDLTI